MSVKKATKAQIINISKSSIGEVFNVKFSARDGVDKDLDITFGVVEVKVNRGRLYAYDEHRGEKYEILDAECYYVEVE